MLCVSNATYTVCKKHSNTHVSSPCPLFSKLWGVSRSKNIQQCNVKVGWYPSVQNAATSLPSPVHYTRHVSKLPMHSLPLPGGKVFLSADSPVSQGLPDAEGKSRQWRHRQHWAAFSLFCVLCQQAHIFLSTPLIADIPAEAFLAVFHVPLQIKIKYF